MALKKVKEIKGLDCEYWKIINNRFDYINNKTHLVLGLYVSETTRNSSVNNYIHCESISLEGVDLTREEMYNGIVESKLNEEDEETNWFADAENLI